MPLGVAVAQPISSRHRIGGRLSLTGEAPYFRSVLCSSRFACHPLSFVGGEIVVSQYQIALLVCGTAEEVGVDVCGVIFEAQRVPKYSPVRITTQITSKS
jgi:hypothetical protein